MARGQRGDTEGTLRGWRGAVGHVASGMRPLPEFWGERAGEKGRREQGLHVWVFLAKGCREACWSAARLRRALLVPPFHEH